MLGLSWRSSAVALLVIVVALGVGCGGGSSTPPACPVDIPSTCPAIAPSFAADVLPLVNRYCGPCHAPNGESASRPLQTYAQISGRAGSIEIDLSSCLMPPSSHAQPTSGERTAILNWIVCGAQDN